MKLFQRKAKKAGAGSEPYTSWKSVLKLYTKFRIPWGMLILLFVFSFGVKEAESRLVPFTSAIETAAIDESGFLIGFILMSIVYGVVQALNDGALDLSNMMTQRNVRHAVWRKMVHLPMSAYDREEPQQFVSRVTQDTTVVYGALSCLIQFASIIYGIYTNFIKMYRLYDMLALIMLSAIPITILTSYICGRMEFKINTIKNNAYARITGFFGERLPNLLHIKTSSMEDEEYERGVASSNAKYRADIRVLNRFIFQSPIGTFAQYFNMIILLIVASAMVRSGVMKMGQMVNLYNYFLLFMSNIFMITAVWQTLKGVHGGCQVIARLMDTEDEKLDGSVSVNRTAGKDIVFDDVHFSYEEGREVLKGVSFVIPEGKVTAIVGENGSGKSTIIRLLERFNDPASGAIRLGGDDMKDINLHQWRDAVGYLFQGDQIVKGSIRENICYGVDRAYTEEEVENAAKAACAYDFIMSKEGGFDAQISRFDSKLSGGEMQRIAIARIILKQTEYLIMDEATSGIDVVSEAQVLEGLNNMMAGKTVIMVSHDMQLIRKADNIVVLCDGEIEACGSYDYVLRHSELFHRFVSA